MGAVLKPPVALLSSPPGSKAQDTLLRCRLRILQTRRQHGEYHRLVQELRLDGERFQRYFRLDRAQFENF
ncbi:hypothetical protein AAFF_G00417180 [Aldrovandia affinis]|uniref:Uncharacterized protein n=1 Tax=Aldrovandia affinis TaxID=143900 RepID=A0AAD7R3C4_9TELE|nr:hypothetical protein AAFF_G00417180 [Aldrovandia affinis]